MLMVLILVIIAMMVVLLALTYYNTVLQNAKRLHGVIIVFNWLFYAFCICGGMFNAIRAPRWYDVNQQSEIVYFAQGTSNQFIVESIIMMMLVCGISLSICYLAHIYWRFYAGSKSTFFPTSPSVHSGALSDYIAKNAAKPAVHGSSSTQQHGDQDHRISLVAVVWL
uniref:Magnesium transporter protein 1 n=1 Tax=Lygus hesperus TaxID=30085 RepID=A0A0A9XVL2_LYGHE